jgi:hypothetical protein
MSVLNLVGAALGGLLNVIGVRLEEQPRYEVLARDGNKEIRRYPSYVMASARAEGTRESSQYRNFRVLADYIFGNNHRREPIAMTTPVLQGQEGEAMAMTAPVLMHPAGATWEMTFILPSTYTLETVPLPNDSRIRLSEAPAEELAVIRFSGAPGDSELLEQTYRLQRWLQGREDYAAGGSYRYAAYDPPFTIPFLRRNEIMIPVARIKRPHAEPISVEHPGRTV